MNVGEERRYIVEFDNFIVLDETGCDLCGSDEVHFVIRTEDYALLSPEYEDADSSYRPWPFEDTSPIPYTIKRCALPAVDGDGYYNRDWKCDQKGRAAPLSFTVAAWEDDGSIYPNFCDEQLSTHPDPLSPDIFFPKAGFCVESRGELIGKVRLEFKIEDLSELQSPGQEVVKEVDLQAGCDFTEMDDCGGSAPHYRLRYVIKRVPDATGGVPVDPNP